MLVGFSPKYDRQLAFQQDQRKHQENDVCDRAVETEIETSDGRDLPARIGERRVRDEHRRKWPAAAPARRTAEPNESGGYHQPNAKAPDLTLSPSEKRTLQKAAEGEFQVAELDWVALQRLKALGFVEERSTAVVITAEGRRVLRTLIAKS